MKEGVKKKVTSKKALIKYGLLGFTLLLIIIGTYIFYPSPNRELKFGEKCKKDVQCRSNLCLFLSPDSEYGFCTLSCAKNEDCPQGYSCSSVTNKGVVVCSPLPSTPFGR